MSAVLERKVPTRKCRVCRAPFRPFSMSHVACGPACAEEVARAKREQQERKEQRAKARAAREDRAETRAKLLDLKPLSYWRDRAQTAFNAWVRHRDAGLPCVSCGRHHQGKWNAGHYLSRGSRPELAFEPLNVHLQCEPCNTSLSGNVVLYRAELVRRIGIEAVEWLEGPHEPMRFRREDFERIERDYKAKTKELKGKTCEN